MKNESVLFLISEYAPIETADQKLWGSFIEKLEIYISRKHPIDILVIECDTTAYTVRVLKNGLNKPEKVY